VLHLRAGNRAISSENPEFSSLSDVIGDGEHVRMLMAYGSKAAGIILS
jgi:hypothetical protein